MTGITEYNWGATIPEPAHSAGGRARHLRARKVSISPRAGRLRIPARRHTMPLKFFATTTGTSPRFGEINVRAKVPNPDNLSAFASVRSSDGRLTLVVITKDLQNYTPVTFNLTNLPTAGTVQAWQLPASGGIVHLPDTTFTNGILSRTLPAQSHHNVRAAGHGLPNLRVGPNSASGQMELWLQWTTRREPTSCNPPLIVLTGRPSAPTPFRAPLSVPYARQSATHVYRMW